MCDAISPRVGIGIVAIGRNEGRRLKRCLQSTRERIVHCVYVDSGSTDGSVDAARGLGADVVEIDTSVPFTAARARNRGVERLRTIAPQVRYVQFIDGDCVLVDGWIEAAMQLLDADGRIGAACGRRREEHPERSIYNRLCDIEWDTPIGEVAACGGDALVRMAALQEVGGYNAKLIAGEEPELCIRLRKAGWTIHRIDHEMALHDADMHRLGQWWKRSVRAGHAYAEVVAMHGGKSLPAWGKQVFSQWLWALVYPVAMLVLALAVTPWALLGMVAYPAQLYRIAHSQGGRWWPSRIAWAYALSCLGSKVAGVVGQTKYWAGRAFGNPAEIIEYKHSAAE